MSSSSWPTSASCSWTADPRSCTSHPTSRPPSTWPSPASCCADSRRATCPSDRSSPAERTGDTFARRCGSDTVILYDEGSADWNENTGGESVLGLLMKRLKDEGCKAYYLEGGYNKFQAEYPVHCETNLDSSCSSSSPPVLGLGGLRISSDSSSDIESDIDRDPSSATDSDGSPLSNTQPSFPVEILPYLYLGCAKDSTNLDVLEEFGIKYILNVTPNLPNLFENAGEFRYKQIPISDHWSQNLSQFFPRSHFFY
ncbi:unnamed protein product [Staurois parvus]|uniref:protein-tyrosine-phosphatase n=1 Tax=Staurois parvus TaxID=386267 RepID=A0ABN9A6P6_9NEOB|nr:unnamed protein product [Staurois parvus]